ncbi:MAG TPA: hypothetical protein VM186_04575 [Planctomycetota bacterium]|nr:hypothetical protein [Planctomycetota bacterium]
MTHNLTKRALLAVLGTVALGTSALAAPKAQHLRCEQLQASRQALTVFS